MILVYFDYGNTTELMGIFNDEETMLSVGLGKLAKECRAEIVESHRDMSLNELEKLIPDC